jgi:predicted ATPase/DNA-binding SARP family transcriptional activator
MSGTPPQSLALRLLGPPELLVDGRPVALERRKALALLAYLAVEPGPHPREALATLLAPDDPPASARAGLRRALVVLGPVARPWLQATGETVALWRGDGLSLDVDSFHAHLAAGAGDALQAATELYRGDFLAGFSLPGSAAFEEWQFFQAERLRGELAGALERLSRHEDAGYDLEAAIAAARRWASLDPLYEPAQRRLLQLFAEAGQHGAALRQYRLFSDTLERELGVAPDPATAALYEQLRRGGRGAQASRWSSAAPRLASAPVSSGAVETGSAPFLGREAELGRVADALADPACRILTLIGPGGMGKTRLALHAAQQHQARFADGVFQISLVGVGSVERLLTTVGAALGVSGQGELADRIAAALRERRALLVLDNADQILDGALALRAIVERTSFVKLLVTSRERLQLQEEWVIDLAGLAVPASAQAPGAAEHSAVQLFAQRARQVRAGFALTPEELPDVVAICRLVEGMPLAIELAAAWVRVLTPAEIARDLEQSMALLTTTLRDVPERHRSVEGVFAQAWERLSGAERQALARLSVFDDGFTRVAATDVAGATTLTLAGLADKALVRRDRTGRYAIHELLRQFAARKLAAEPAEEQAALLRFCRFNMRLLAERNDDLQGSRQRHALAELDAEYDNLHKAWVWAVRGGQVAELQRGLDGMYRLHEMRGWYRDGIQVLGLLCQELQGGPASEGRTLLVARAQARLGALSCWVGQFAAAEDLLAAALPVLRSQGAALDAAFALTGMGIVASEREDDRSARRLLDEALAAYKALGSQSGVAWALDALGDLAGSAGDYRRAKQLFDQSSTIFSALGDQVSVAWSLTSLGRVLGLMGEHTEGRQLLDESLALFEALGDKHGSAAAYANLGEIALLAHDHAAARAAWLTALGLAHEVGATPLLLDALVGIAQALAATGAATRAHELATMVLEHPAAWRESLAAAAETLERSGRALGPRAAAEAARRGRATGWERAVEELRSEH